MDTKILSELEEQIYFFAVNVVSFAKTLQKANTEINPQIVNFAGELNSVFMDSIDNQNIELQKRGLEKSKELAKKCHKIFMQFSSEKKELLNENANLQIECSSIIKKLSTCIESEAP